MLSLSDVRSGCNKCVDQDPDIIPVDLRVRQLALKFLDIFRRLWQARIVDRAKRVVIVFSESPIGDIGRFDIPISCHQRRSKACPPAISTRTESVATVMRS